jgi:kynurenine formamidase
MREDLKAGRPEAFLPAHRVGREREYCHIEKLANLHTLPRPFGFKVSVFPISIARASGAWCRAVAILEA